MKKAMLHASLAVCLLLPFFASAAEPLNTLLVVPARLRLIQLAFDMQSLRNAEVVSWRATADPSDPELNYWTGREWKPISLNQFRSAEPLVRKPKKTIFLGFEAPAVLTEAPLPGIARFETVDMAELVNNLNAFYAFSDGEWRLLKKRYDFTLYDANARLREQNPYSQPRPEEPKVKRSPVLFDKNPPPAKVNMPAKVTRAIPPKAAAAPAKETTREAAPETLKVEAVESAPVKLETPKTEAVQPAAVESEAELNPDVPAPVESKPVAAPEAK